MNISLYKDDGGYAFVVKGNYYNSPFDHFDDIAILLKLLPIWQFDLINERDYLIIKTNNDELIATIGE